MKDKLKDEMLEAIFVQTGGREENIKIAEICADIAVKFISSNGMLAGTSPIDWESKWQAATLQKYNLQKEVDRLREKYEPKAIVNEYKGA